MSRVIEYTVPEEFGGKRLIAFLRGSVKVSARMLTQLKKDPDGLLKNGEHIRTIDTVHTGDIIQIKFPNEANGIEPADYSDMKIVYEDDDILVINKPPFLAVHPTHNHQGDTLANKVAGYMLSKGKNPVFRAVGRLDKSTSGLIICALNKHSAFQLSGNGKKEYLAVAEGKIDGKGTINKPICRPDPLKTLRAVGETGDRSVTHYESLLSNGELTLLRVTLETGRTHQIRVHFSSIGHPLAGDEMYGGKRDFIDRAALHCEKISFVHPVSGENLDFTAEIPEDMKKLVWN
ncbi:MAG: RluA family pseudouridine synthase [Oscillospiraceae bacterium]|nr:RluA family pseudouridine synthase [Oscillospiraceae bacterium]